MAGWRQAIELALSEEEVTRLTAVTRSRTELASRVERARMLLAYRQDGSFFAVARAIGVHHQTVQRCVERALAFGAMAALDDLPRPGRKPTITAEAKAWVVNLACRKAKELGYPHELWTTRLLAAHVREHGPGEGDDCLGKLAQGTLCIILNEQEIKPYKVRYDLERRALHSSPPAASNSPSRPRTVPGSISSKGSSPSSLVRCCATSASHPNRNSRIALWLPWITSITIPVVHTWSYKLDRAA
jgi:transposase